MKPLLFRFGLLLLMAAVAGCTQKKKKNNQPVDGATITANAAGYAFDQPEEKQLPSDLTEISGINYLSNNKLAAQQDEDGIIFIVDPLTGNIDSSHKFGPANDYEDIVAVGDYYYVLNSNGDIYKADRKNPSKRTTSVFTFGKKNMEFESLYADSDGKHLMLICKSCAGKDYDDAIDAYSFDLEKEIYDPAPVYSIDEALVRKNFQLGKKRFRPSAAAIHPIEKKLYVLCSVGSVLLVSNLKGEVENVYPLNPKLYPQPEGIAFAPGGDLYISNEGGEGYGTLLHLPYRTK
jgi:hypothetical protein